MAYRPTPRTEARRAEVRARIVRAAFELIRRGGYREASVAAVAAGAGVATGTVYRHFPSKADLFAEVFRVASQHEVDAVAAADVRARLGPRRARWRRRDVRAARAARPPAGLGAAGRAGGPGRRGRALVFRRAYAPVFSSALREGVLNGSLPPRTLISSPSRSSARSARS